MPRNRLAFVGSCWSRCDYAWGTLRIALSVVPVVHILLTGHSRHQGCISGVPGCRAGRPLRAVPLPRLWVSAFLASCPVSSRSTRAALRLPPLSVCPGDASVRAVGVRHGGLTGPRGAT